MKSLDRALRRILLLSSIASAPFSLGAQDSLRVLRITPEGRPTGAEPVVITFDHPVAPRLDASVDPGSVVRVLPAVKHLAYWRDPSTLVVQFDMLWSPGSRYRVDLDSHLRSSAGLALAEMMPFVFTVAGARPLALLQSRTNDPADTIVRAFAVMSAPVRLRDLIGRATLLPDSADCGTLEAIPLRPVVMRPVDAKDPYAITEAGGYDRDRRGDGDRRVVELVAARAVMRGCTGRLAIQAPEGARLVVPLQVKPLFRAVKAFCATSRVSDCPAGPIELQFTQPVKAEEMRAHVRVDGKAPTIAARDSSVQWIVLDSVTPRSRHLIEVDSGLRSATRERIAAAAQFTVVVDPPSPGVGLSSGSIVVPRSDGMLIAIRHRGVDTIVVTVAHLADSARISALTPVNPYSGENRRWRALIADSVVLRYPVVPPPLDSEGVLIVPTTDLPPEWRQAPMLAVRASGAGRKAVSDSSFDGLRESGRVSTIHVLTDWELVSIADPHFAVVRRTDLAMHVWHAEGDTRVWVTGVRDAQARAGVTVRVLDGTGAMLAQATTDRNGLARVRYGLSRDTTALGEARVLEARIGDDVSYQLLAGAGSRRAQLQRRDDERETWGWGGIGSTTEHGVAFPDRDIYRPGESVYLKGIVRHDDPDRGYSAARGDSARWVIQYYSSAGSVRVWTRAMRLGDFGTTVDTFAIPRLARLGRYAVNLDLRRDGVWWQVANTDFAVAEYRVPEFAVTAAVDSSRRIFAGDTARVRVEARYLFGLPMQGANTGWWARLTETDSWRLHVAGLEGWNVGRSWWSERGAASISTNSAQPSLTDSAGRVTLAVPVEMMSRPGTLQVSAAVTDANRQTITSVVSLPVQAADLYIGARFAASKWEWPAGSPIPLRALVVGLDGRHRAGVTVSLFAVRHGWADGKPSADTVWRDQRVTTTDTLRVAVTLGRPGIYELVLTARDARRREALTSVVTWVNDPRAIVAMQSPDALSISADRPSYNVGDRAAIRVDAADDGPAWLTLLRGGHVDERLVQLHRGLNELSVPIPGWAAPEARITLLALRPIPRGDTSQVFARRGSVDIAVASDASRLAVRLVPERTRYAPRQRVRLTLHVRDAAGRPVRAEAAVWAVDQGVASLTDLAAPDLLQTLLGARTEPMSLLTTIDALAPWLPPAIRSQVGDIRIRGAGNPAFRINGRDALTQVVAEPVVGRQPSPREVFVTTPLYRGAVTTNAQGDATVEFELPDNLTTFRLFAAAVAEGLQAGTATSSIVSTRTLAVRPALPRAIRDGDTLLAGAVVTQDRVGPAPIALHVEGSGILIDDPATRVDTLVGRRAREIRFALRGVAGDTAVLRFDGHTATDADAVAARLPVSPAGHPRAHVVMGTLRDSAVIDFAIDRTLDTVRSRLELQLGTNPLPMLERLGETLRLYPFDCTEQLASAGRALVARIRAERLAGGPAQLRPRDRDELERGAAAIVGRQEVNGGFGYWSATDWTTPWLTAYALDYLSSARDLGIDVPDGIISAARHYLSLHSAPALHRVDGQPVRYTYRTDTLSSDAELLAAALTERALQHPDTVSERVLLARRRQLGWLDRLTLAQLLAARGDSVGARALLAQAWNASHVDGRRIVLDDSVARGRRMFRSVLRPIATLLTTAAMLTPNDDRLQPLFESLLQVARSGGSPNLNTIDAALASEAVLAMLGRTAATARREVTVAAGERTIAIVLVTDTHADTVHLPIPITRTAGTATADTARLTVRGSREVPTYFAATLFEVPAARPVRADDEGISVERWYERFDASKPIVAVREGELVRVRIRITVPRDRQFVAIEDPLPAGLEAVDLSLRTSPTLPPTARALKRSAGQDAPSAFGSWDSGWWTPWEHREIRDDRVLYVARELQQGSYDISYVARATTAGTFVRPPAHAEEMYNPAVHGRSDGGWFTVTAAPEQPTKRTSLQR